jgi:hypothetical protein
MADMPFFCGYAGSSGSGSGKNYDDLQNKPVINLTGDPVVIAELDTGVYNIDGTWAMTVDSEAMDTQKDDLFYVKNDGNNDVLLTWVTAGGMTSYKVAQGGTADDVVVDSVLTAEGVADQMLGFF